MSNDSKECAECGETKVRSAFSKGQLKKKGKAKCKDCVAAAVDADGDGQITPAEIAAANISVEEKAELQEEVAAKAHKFAMMMTDAKVKAPAAADDGGGGGGELLQPESSKPIEGAVGDAAAAIEEKVQQDAAEAAAAEAAPDADAAAAAAAEQEEAVAAAAAEQEAAAAAAEQEAEAAEAAAAAALQAQAQQDADAAADAAAAAAAEAEAVEQQRVEVEAAAEQKLVAEEQAAAAEAEAEQEEQRQREEAEAAAVRKAAESEARVAAELAARLAKPKPPVREIKHEIRVGDVFKDDVDATLGCEWLTASVRSDWGRNLDGLSDRGSRPPTWPPSPQLYYHTKPQSVRPADDAVVTLECEGNGAGLKLEFYAKQTGEASVLMYAIGRVGHDVDVVEARRYIINVV